MDYWQLGKGRWRDMKSSGDYLHSSVTVCDTTELYIDHG